jgi:hypothetical protein
VNRPVIVRVVLFVHRSVCVEMLYSVRVQLITTRLHRAHGPSDAFGPGPLHRYRSPTSS